MLTINVEQKRTNKSPLTACILDDMPIAQVRLRTKHQIVAVIINIVSLS